jgi:hypothetical protein
VLLLLLVPLALVPLLVVGVIVVMVVFFFFLVVIVGAAVVPAPIPSAFRAVVVPREGIGLVVLVVDGGSSRSSCTNAASGN